MLADKCIRLIALPIVLKLPFKSTLQTWYLGLLGGSSGEYYLKPVTVKRILPPFINNTVNNKSMAWLKFGKTIYVAINLAAYSWANLS